VSKTSKPFHFYLMHTAISKTESTLTSFEIAPVAQYIYALLLVDGRIVVGQHHNPAKKVQRINSGYCKQIPGALQVSRIIGIKEVNETRNLCSVVNQFCKDFGEERVLCL
jgi:hypothetical protein